MSFVRNTDLDKFDDIHDAVKVKRTLHETGIYAQILKLLLLNKRLNYRLKLKE